MLKHRYDVANAVPFFDDDVVEADVLVQAGETLLWGWTIHNVSAADAFLLLYDAAAVADVTVGTTVATYVVPNAANAMASEALYCPLRFSLGLVIASVTATDGSTGAAQDVSLMIS